MIRAAGNLPGEEILKRFSAVAALCLPLFACAGAEPEWPGFLRARASLEVPAGASRAGAAVEVVLDDIPPGYQIERVVLVDPGVGTRVREETRIGRRVLARVPIADPAAFRDHPKRWRLEVTYLDITGERRSVILPLATDGR